jgi:hypothetical protein
VEEGQQHIAMADWKFIAITLPYQDSRPRREAMPVKSRQKGEFEFAKLDAWPERFDDGYGSTRNYKQEGRLEDFPHKRPWLRGSDLN